MAAKTDDQFLDMVQKQSWSFFWRECSHGGLIADKAYANGSSFGTESSIAAIGFGLTATCISHSRGWISYTSAYNRVWNTLKLFRSGGGAAGTNGFFYHMLEKNTGLRSGITELSSVDTALLMSGVLFAGAYFKNTPIETVADEIYRNCDWTWMCAGSNFICMGWKPANDGGNFVTPYSNGFRCSSFWNNYNESPLIDILAIGSPTHRPVNSPACWTDMAYRTGNYDIYTGIRYAPGWFNPLFLHQDTQLWVDLKKRTYNSINYYSNSVKATLANKKYCELEWSSFCPNGLWGFSICTPGNAPTGDGQRYYGAKPWDVPPEGVVPPGLGMNGVIAPHAAGASFMFTPVESMGVLRSIYSNYPSCFGTYAFTDGMAVYPSFSCSPYVVGLDVGATMLSIENARSGMVWDIFMQVPYIQDALDTVGFMDTGDNIRPSMISDLDVENNFLVWTAPSDNGIGSTGKAASYEIRYSTRMINSYADWYDAAVLSQSMDPSAAGIKEKLPLTVTNPGTYYFAIRATDAAGNRSILAPNSAKLMIGNVSSLSQNFPNPFYMNRQSTTRFRYTLGENGHVKLKLYSVSGFLVKEWDEGDKPASSYIVDWNGLNRDNSAVSPGIYSLVFFINEKRLGLKKIVVLR